MIVDLIRNDLGRIAETGSVAVKALFEVETYPTLHTMVSTVTARKRADAGMADILRALFPCGSVTGAPKIRAMEILRELENSPRGAYCGAVGYFAPAPTVNSAHFNVAIRTLTICGGPGELGIGGGVVQDSRERQRICRMPPQGALLRGGRPPLELIETLQWDDGFRAAGRPSGADGGIRRRSWAWPLIAAPPRRAGGAVAGRAVPLRVRLTLDEAGAHHATAPNWTPIRRIGPMPSRRSAPTAPICCCATRPAGGRLYESEAAAGNR